MDVEGLLQGVIRFSNFMTARLIVSGLFFYVIAGFTDIGSTAEGILPNLELVNQVVANYQTIFDILGVSDFALLLIFFLFLTAIHITYVGFERVGEYIPPAILPLPGWDAIDDLTSASFDILREARGEEHSEEENQRLFEFKRKLEDIDDANELKYEAGLEATYAAFRISKSFVLFSLCAWVVAILGGRYAGDARVLLVILGLSAMVALYTTLSIYRSHHSRIEDLRGKVIHQFTGFAGIWLPAAHHQRVVETCAPSRDLRPASFKILFPVFGTLDVFFADMHKWLARRRRQRLNAPVIPAPDTIVAPAMAPVLAAPDAGIEPLTSAKQKRKKKHG
ncbi:hypothetical protein DFR52_10624 [Hoeflea marina]|uniref:Uncharacterized protein n=1 Tax=Hoeflea marina TaxID=274592 RepID=A0A317PFQ3_9HYPH|nr:hypothetical protein [Hoeflea marina]PWV97501.1 hypothetical protein DFR52_10624 [Hoeflea marina]